jgi:hypothetical protein
MIRAATLEKSKSSDRWRALLDDIGRGLAKAQREGSSKDECLGALVLMLCEEMNVDEKQISESSERWWTLLDDIGFGLAKAQKEGSSKDERLRALVLMLDEEMAVDDRRQRDRVGQTIL